MFNKLKNDIASIKRSVAQILANTEYLSVQNSAPYENLYKSSIRDKAVSLVGKWVKVTPDIQNDIKTGLGIYCVACANINEVALSGKKPFTFGVHLFLVDINHCTADCFEKDGVSLKTFTVMNRAKEVVLSGECVQEKVLTALSNNIIQNLESLVM